MNLKDIVNKYFSGEKEKKIKNLIVIFLIGVVFVITASFFKGSNNPKSKSTVNTNKVANENTNDKAVNEEGYEQVIKSELVGILSKLDGVGRVEVMVTFESGEEQVPAVNSNDSTSSVQDSSNGDKSTTTQGNNSRTVVTQTDQNGSTSPFITETIAPKVRSVFVVAEGAENSLTQLRISKSVMDLLNITESKVNVYPMKKTNQ